jgi:YfiR/HmsC-like
MLRGVSIGVCVLALAMTAAAQSPRAPEYQVKAAFLYNFAKFVEWPSRSFAGPSTPFRICVLGHDPFGDALTSIVQGKSISSHPIVAMTLPSGAEIRPCHVLFLSHTDPEILKPALERMRGFPILTVGESADFVTLGGMINFVLEEDRVRFEINLGAAEQHHLKLSSKLLAVARVVNVGGGTN